MHRTRVTARLVASTAAALTFAALASAQLADVSGKTKLNPDHSIDVATFRMPFSEYASPEAQKDQADLFRRRADLAAPDLGKQAAAISEARERTDRILYAPWLELQRRRYAVDVTEQSIGGIGVQVFVPRSGVKPENRHRVLIDLHGGGFVVGWGVSSQVESIPMSAVGGIKVISVNYRMFPEARFPAASKDVATVYRELLKTYRPSDIAIYGCSAGGMLTGQAIAWFQKVGLPMPAAVGIQSASLSGSFLGDSSRWSAALGSFQVGGSAGPYFNDLDMNDPLVAPAASSATLARFPPTMLMTGTRAGDMSSTINAHVKLVAAGAEARLMLWDGLDHCFQYNPDLPESRQAYQVMLRFFREAMDARPGSKS